MSPKRPWPTSVFSSHINTTNLPTYDQNDDNLLKFYIKLTVVRYNVIHAHIGDGNKEMLSY